MSWFKFGRAANRAELTKKRPLPLGKAEFHAWAENIIAGAYIPGATSESIKFALANEIMHINPTEDQECDLYFIKKLRKFAANQVADDVRRELYENKMAREAAEEEAKKSKLSVVETNPAEVTAQTSGTSDEKVLSNT